MTLASVLITTSVACRPGAEDSPAVSGNATPPGSEATADSPPRPRSPLCRDPETYDRLLDLPPPGEPITLRGSETDAFPIATTAGETLEILADQEGIDVYLALFEEQGERLVATDRPTARLGEERLIWVGESDRTLRLHVCAWGSQGISGTYTLRVQRRPTEPGDDATVAAYRQTEEAKRLLRLGPTRWDDALDAFRLAVAQEVHPSGQFLRTEARYRMARLLQDQQRFEDALEILDALHLQHDHRAFPELALRILNRRALVQRWLLRPEEAEVTHLQAVSLAQHTEHPYLLGEAYYDLGHFYDFSGDAYVAIDAFDQALQHWLFLEDEENLARTLHSRGLTYRTLGKFRQAVDDFEQALEIRQRLELTQARATTLHTLGTTLDDDGDTAAAEAALREALDIYENTGNVAERASVLTSLASNLFVQGRFEEALEAGLLAEPETTARSTRLQKGILQHNIGLALQSLGQLDESMSRYRAALDHLTPIRDLRATSLTKMAIAHVHEEQGDLHQALESIRDAIADIEEYRSTLMSYDLRSSYLATRRTQYELHVDLLMKLGVQDQDPLSIEAALLASEKARARSQLDAFADRLSSGPEVPSRAESATLGEVINRLEEARSRIKASGDDSPDVRRIERELRDRLQVFRRDRVRGGETTGPQAKWAPSVVSLQELLDDDTTVLEFHLGYRKSFLWIVTRDRIESVELTQKSEVESLAREGYRLVASSYRRRLQFQTSRTLCELSRSLFGNALQQITSRRLIIASEGALSYIPFAALPHPESCQGLGFDDPGWTPLVEDFEVVAVPSLSMLQALRESAQNREQPSNDLLILANPRFGSKDQDPLQRRQFDPLDHSEHEAEAILQFFPANGVLALTGSRATRVRLLSQPLEDFRVLHFATHGELNTEHPELSRLVLAAPQTPGRPEDHFIFAHEVSRLTLNADLVVLSACETALGAEIRGEGIVGLPQAFIMAGASAVVVSLWKVDDKATGLLMSKFYEASIRDGQSLPEALANAQRKVRESHPAPYYWAGFVLQGNWIPFDRQHRPRTASVNDTGSTQ